MVKVGNQCSATSHEIFKSKMVNPRGRFSATGHPFGAKTSLRGTLANCSGGRPTFQCLALEAGDQLVKLSIPNSGLA